MFYNFDTVSFLWENACSSNRTGNNLWGPTTSSNRSRRKCITRWAGRTAAWVEPTRWEHLVRGEGEGCPIQTCQPPPNPSSSPPRRICAAAPAQRLAPLPNAPRCPQPPAATQRPTPPHAAALPSRIQPRTLALSVDRDGQLIESMKRWSVARITILKQ